MRRPTVSRPQPARRPPLVTAIRHNDRERISYHFDEVAWAALRLVIDIQPDGT